MKLISLYSGTPRSGKSLHVAKDIYVALKKGIDVIANFEIDVDAIKNCKGEFVFIETYDLTTEYFENYALSRLKRNRKGKVIEGQFLIVIDECADIFNSRLTNAVGRLKWCTFFRQHGKYGYDCILISQDILMIDKQIRQTIEYNYIHRKLKNFGWKGLLLSALMGFGLIFAVSKVWIPCNQKMGVVFFKMQKKYSRIYDSYKIFDIGKVGATSGATAEPISNIEKNH